jgi:hypothetical protein
MTTAAPSHAVSNPVVAKYVRDLERRGFCTIDDMSANQTRLLNRFDGRKLPFSFFRNDFRTYLRRNSLACEFPEPGYLAACLPHVVGTIFKPGAGAFFTDPLTGVTFANGYRAYDPTHEHAEVSPLFLDFIASMFPKEDECHVFNQYIAHAIQLPQERPSWHVMIPSDTGTGKGFLLQEVLDPLLLHTSVISSFDRLTGQFSAVLENNLLVLLDDCKARSDATQTKLKSILSEERQFVEHKNLQGGMVKTYTRMILASNEHKPLHIDASERRWWVASRVEHRVDRADTQKRIERLAAWLKEPGALCAVYNFYRTYDLTGFNAKSVPPSHGLEDLIALSRDPYADFMAEYTADHPVFTYVELVSAISNASLSKPNDRYLGHLIGEAGFHKKRPFVGGTQTTLYLRKTMPVEQAVALYKPASF